MREYRASLKEYREKNLTYLEKDKERKKIVRAREKENGLGIDVINHRHLMYRRRVADYRSKKKASPLPSPAAIQDKPKLWQSYMQSFKVFAIQPKEKGA